jgi:hypothetical protein
MKKESSPQRKYFFTDLLTKVGLEIKIAIEEALQSLKNEYNAKKTASDKSMPILQGVVLILLGVYAILPLYENIMAVLIGGIFGLFSTIESPEELKKKPITLKSLLGTLLGITVGMISGTMPVIGMGITIGITKALAGGILDVLDIERAKMAGGKSAISIISDRLKIGLLTGIVPIVGPLIAVDKLNKARQMIHLPRKKISPTNKKSSKKPNKSKAKK